MGYHDIKISMIKLINKRLLVFTGVLVLLFVIVVVIVKNRVSIPVVINTIPTNNEEETLETAQISINFNTDIKDQTKNEISVSFEPQLDFDSTWLVNTYKVVPKNPLKNNTKYTASVLYQNKEIYTFSFTTQFFSQEAIRKYGYQQATDDLLYGQALTQIVKDHPWYPNLPIKTENYVVYYDFGQEKFAITFLNINITSEQKKTLIQDAQERIIKIGGKEPVQYYTQP